MATESDKGKEKESERESPKQTTTWLGRFHEGKWFCDCDGNRRARLLTVRKVSSANHGKKFWTCPKGRDEQCPFFIWADEEADAKEWLAKNRPLIPPVTPTSKKGTRPDDSAFPKTPETPWTKAKRKPVSREVSDENDHGGPSNQNIDGSEIREFEEIDTPSRKAAKAMRFSTPGQTSKDKPKNTAESLPSPDSSKQPVSNAMASRPRPPNGTLPMSTRPENAISLNNERSSNLTATVLKLIHSEGVELKESTDLQIRHEIDMEVDLNEAKVRRYEGTISKMSKRIDELESIVLHLTGDVAVNETMEQSD